MNFNVDVDSVELWRHGNPQDPIFSMVRAGFGITFTNFTLLLVSKLHANIYLYALHYEYVALSYSVRYLTPLRGLIKKFSDNLGMDSENVEFLSRSNFHEGNDGAVVVVKSPSMTHTSNLISIN